MIEPHQLSAKPAVANPLDVQMGGAHYKRKAIQPVEYISANNLNFLEGCVVKRITRWRDKPGQNRFEDLRKIQHEIDLLIAMEERFNPEPASVGSKLDAAAVLQGHQPSVVYPAEPKNG